MVVVPGLELAELAALPEPKAIGLVVPGSGPRVSEEAAIAALERGEVRNSLRGGLPSGPAIVDVTVSSTLPDSPAIVLGLPAGGDQPNDRRYPIAVLGAGYEGLLVSERTRIPGLVSIVDVAPTALGRPDGLESTGASDPERQLRALDARIDDNGDVRATAALLAGLLVLLLALVLPRAALLGFPAALAANLVLGGAGVSEPWLVLLVIGLAVAVGAPGLAVVLRSPGAVGAALAGVVLAYLVVLGVDGEAVSLSPLGPTQNSRFYGLSNLLAALLLVPALGGAALLRIAYGWIPGLAVAAASLVAIAGSRFGADGGTGIVLCVAFAVLAVELADARRRVVAWIVAAAFGAGIALIAFDALSGASSHLTDAVGGGPANFLEDLGDRVVLSWERATDRWFLAVLVAAGAVALAALAVRLVRGPLPRELRALPLALAVATGVSLLVNDSPLDVVAVGLSGYLAAYGYVSRDPGLASYRE